MPGPVSATSRATERPSLRARNIICPPLDKTSTALLMRLYNTSSTKRRMTKTEATSGPASTVKEIEEGRNNCFFVSSNSSCGEMRINGSSISSWSIRFLKRSLRSLLNVSTVREDSTILSSFLEITELVTCKIPSSAELMSTLGQSAYELTHRLGNSAAKARCSKVWRSCIVSW